MLGKLNIGKTNSLIYHGSHIWRLVDISSILVYSLHVGMIKRE